MSNMKNGLSTLNRWLGKKTKSDKVATNGKLSKSSTNLNSLSVSSTNINETSQLEYNRITPLPVATSNAPFEQTFRITVLLPKDQLYVARLGARVALSKLLELVCENKLLDPTKYEFRNPVDPSQVYSCDLSIGAVGLSEVRLCHKSESYDSFNADEIIKLHRTAIIRDSLSSSEFSSRYSKHTTKTTSPYSSSNSLNSMDSTGVNCVRTPVSPPPTLTTSTTPLKISAPPRKKRAAPRPPSQIAIPEKTVVGIDDEPKFETQNSDENENVESQNQSVTTNNRYVSTPNLSSKTALYIDKVEQNGNLSGLMVKTSPSLRINDYSHENIDQDISSVQQKNARNLYSGSVQNLSSQRVLQQSIQFPEPSPRKRVIQVKKKTAAPAPPSRGNMYVESDTVSIRSMVLSTPDTPSTPLTATSSPDGESTDSNMDIETSPITRKKEQSARDSQIDITRLSSSTPVFLANSSESTKEVKNEMTKEQETLDNSPVSSKKEQQSSTAQACGSPPEKISSESTKTFLESNAGLPKPMPRVTANTILNETNLSIENSDIHLPTTNVSKTMLNRTPTPEPRSLSTEPSDSDSFLSSHISTLKSTSVLDNYNDNDVPVKPEDTGSYSGAHIEALKNVSASENDDDALSKQADSGIGELVPSPIPDSLPSEGSAHEGKSVFESSSDDDDIVKIYNFKLGKTVVKTPPDPQTLEDFTILTATAQSDSRGNTPAPITQEATPNFSDSASWNFSIPISPPPNFADGRIANGFEIEKTPDIPITPKIKERPVLNFEAISNAEKTETATSRTMEPHTKAISNHSSEALKSPTTPLNEIVEELNSIINENRMDSLIKKADDETRIEAAKPNTLANFSITTITKQTQEKQTEIRNCSEVKNAISLEMQVGRDNYKGKHKGHNPKCSESEIRHKPNITENEANANISQTSIAPDESLSNGKIEQNEFNSTRRRSSGELSIGEPPSLQSPEVIKTILNSRKNSIVSNGDSEGKIITEISKLIENKIRGNVNESPEEEEVPKSLNVVEKTAEAKDSTTPTKPKEPPKVYRYSGPPSINFSTWNERPKAQVAIKNEGDYIFGGKNADSQSAAVTTAAIEISSYTHAHNNYRVSMPANNFWTERENTPPPISPKPQTNISPTDRMGMLGKDTFKPLRDVSLLNGTKNNESPQPITKITFRKPTIITKVLLNGDSELQTNKLETDQKRSFAGTTHTSTLPRSNANRFSMPAGNILGPALLRSTSITQLEANKPKQFNRETVAAPFGQNTLRKTGLKEKILAKEAESQQKVDEENRNHAKTSISNGFMNTKNPESTKQVKLIQSAKLELKLQSSTSVYLNDNTNLNTTTTPTTISKQESMAKSMPIIPPAPPAPSKQAMEATAALKSLTLNIPNGSAATTPNSPEPRDQLLLAIRNFKREELNRIRESENK